MIALPLAWGRLTGSVDYTPPAGPPGLSVLINDVNWRRRIIRGQFVASRLTTSTGRCPERRLWSAGSVKLHLRDERAGPGGAGPPKGIW